jgi:hypothetical protein
LRQRSGSGAAWGLCARQIHTGKRLTLAAEFSKKEAGMCEDQDCVAFLDVWSVLFNEL